MLSLARVSRGVQPLARFHLAVRAQPLKPSVLPLMPFTEKIAKPMSLHGCPRSFVKTTGVQGEGKTKNTGQIQSALPQEEKITVNAERVPLEEVIQFEKAPSSAFSKWRRIGVLAGGDVLGLLLFAAIGRSSHGLPIYDAETVHTADPFIAGWLLSAYFLGGYGPDGRGTEGLRKAVLAAAKSWAIGIPLGLVIRSSVSGHMTPTAFVLVSMGSTAFLLIGWRTMLNFLFPVAQAKGNGKIHKH